jgi:hypothetical protein
MSPVPPQPVTHTIGQHLSNNEEFIMTKKEQAVEKVTASVSRREYVARTIWLYAVLDRS